MMKPGEDTREEVLAKLNSMPSAEAIRRQVALNKSEVILSGYEPASDEIEVANGMPGEISLELTVPEMAGLEVKLDRSKLAGGERAKIHFQYHPPNKLAKDPLQATLRVLPIQRVIPIRVSFTLPPELRKHIRKQ
jgi:hypothetical protein